jgi:hypothetical protein
MDYFVPNFGVDADVLTTFNSLNVAEKIRRHRWNAITKPPKPEDPVLYNENQDLDDDIALTNSNMAEAEQKFGTWDYKALQLGE